MKERSSWHVAKGPAWMALAAALLAAPAHPQAKAFDHSAFDALLRKNVVGGMVNYDAFEKAQEFAAYLASLDKADPRALPKPERLAYWINAYNAYTIQLILSHHERDSIRNINKTAGLSFHGPWHEKLVRAGGHVYHLDNVEHDIIRGKRPQATKDCPDCGSDFNELRIHFALVCAAMGCPPLRSEAYTGARLDAQLTDQAKTFLLDSPKKNHVDVGQGIFSASQIMSKYYRDDFGGDDATIARTLSKFYPEGREKSFLAGGRVKIVPTEYDWTLNSQEKAAAPPKK